VANYVLSYSVDPTNPSPAFPNRTTTCRPRLAVTLISGNESFACYALIDSGADDCIFPASFGTVLGLNVRTGRHYTFGGAGGGGVQSAYFFDLQIAIQNVGKYKMPIGFTTALQNAGIGLLGQNGFFDRFRIGFNLRKGIFTLTR